MNMNYPSVPSLKPKEAIPAFAPLVFKEWKNLNGLTPARPVAQRELLYPQAQLRTCAFLIESGIVKLVRVENDGTEFVMGLRSNGWVLDAAATFLNTPAAYAAVTLTPCSVRRIPRQLFMQLSGTNPSFLRDLYELMCCEVQAVQQLQVELRNGSANSRLHRLIAEIGRDRNSIDPLSELPLKRFEIAQLLAITPEHLSRLLHSYALATDAGAQLVTV